jgi:hypothetical protein
MAVAAALLLALFFRPPRALQTSADERQPEGERESEGSPATAS